MLTSTDASIFETNLKNVLIATGIGCRKQISNVFKIELIHFSKLFVESIEDLGSVKG